MKHVSILTLYDATLTSIDSSHQIFTRVNDFMRYQNRPPFYEVELVGLNKDMDLGGGLYSIHADKTIDEVKETDVVVIPLLCGDFKAAIKKNSRYRDWVIAQHHRKADIVCLCVGILLSRIHWTVERKAVCCSLGRQKRIRGTLPAHSHCG